MTLNDINTAFNPKFSFSELKKELDNRGGLSGLIKETEQRMCDDIMTHTTSALNTTINSNSAYMIDSSPNCYTLNVATASDVTSLQDKIEKIKKDIETLKKDKENGKTMNNIKLNFGPVENNSMIKYSVYGIALAEPATTKAYAYDYASDTLMDVSGLTMNPSGILYKIPINIHAVREGMYILTDNDDVICVVDDAEYTGNGVNGFSLKEHRMTNYYPAENAFGVNYVTRIVNLLEDNFTVDLDDKMFMFMLMNNNNGNNNNLLPMLMLTKDGIKPAIDKKLFMMMCMNNNNNNDMLPLIMAIKNYGH